MGVVQVLFGPISGDECGGVGVHQYCQPFAVRSPSPYARGAAPPSVKTADDYVVWPSEARRRTIHAATWVRFSNPSFCRMCATWLAAVPMVMTNSLASFLFV